jgi:hypothetical protein
VDIVAKKDWVHRKLEVKDGNAHDLVPPYKQFFAASKLSPATFEASPTWRLERYKDLSGFHDIIKVVRSAPGVFKSWKPQVIIYATYVP